jgi:hypothetical protein
MDEGVRAALKLGIKTFLRLRQRAIERSHELAETWEDLVAEVRVEQAAQAAAQPGTSDGPRAAAAPRAAPPHGKQRGAPADETGQVRAKKTAARRRTTETPSREPIPLDKVRLKPEDRVAEANAPAPRPGPRQRSRKAKTEPD